MIDDWDLISASIQEQYGLRLSRELPGMSWTEFRSLLVGISPDTVLGRIVQIRSEKDAKRIRQFSPEQRKIRNAWISKSMQKKKKEMKTDDMDKVLDMFKNAFISMAGKEKKEKRKEDVAEKSAEIRKETMMKQ